eukprot:scaffold3052_cov389-Prasinococcus_capsulatus_cf.AAC.13
MKVAEVQQAKYPADPWRDRLLCRAPQPFSRGYLDESPEHKAQPSADPKHLQRGPRQLNRHICCCRGMPTTSRCVSSLLVQPSQVFVLCSAEPGKRQSDERLVGTLPLWRLVGKAPRDPSPREDDSARSLRPPSPYAC